MNDNLGKIREWFEYVETESTLVEPVQIDRVLEEKMHRLLNRRLLSDTSLELNKS